MNGFSFRSMLISFSERNNKDRKNRLLTIEDKPGPYVPGNTSFIPETCCLIPYRRVWIFARKDGGYADPELR
ncbi:hypothetical protein DLM77_19740 [Leptospira yasudae]|uniref:Uncharacterized protein n=1 Tax=Leptospira yasudae TaxID=2202201 RepID=A0ABX9LYA0_9LEPT|nr:hypothetical protein DLM77_19740 [Leptospira yasudae]